MLLHVSVAVMNRWHELTHPKEVDRGDGPVPTVIIWIGVAIIAMGLLTWAGIYVHGLTANAPANTPAYPGP